MTKFRIIGFLFGVVGTIWFAYALVEGEVGLSQSQLQTDVKTISRAEDPSTFFLVMGVMGGLIVAYWVVLFWLLRTVLPGIMASRAER